LAPEAPSRYSVLFEPLVGLLHDIKAVKNVSMANIVVRGMRIGFMETLSQAACHALPGIVIHLIAKDLAAFPLGLFHFRLARCNAGVGIVPPVSPERRRLARKAPL